MKNFCHKLNKDVTSEECFKCFLKHSPYIQMIFCIRANIDRTLKPPVGYKSLEKKKHED